MSVALRCVLRDQEPPGILCGQGVQGPSGAGPTDLEKNQQHCQLFPLHAESSAAVCESLHQNSMRLSLVCPGESLGCAGLVAFWNGSWSLRKFSPLFSKGRTINLWSLLAQGFLPADTCWPYQAQFSSRIILLGWQIRSKYPFDPRWSQDWPMRGACWGFQAYQNIPLVSYFLAL